MGARALRFGFFTAAMIPYRLAVGAAAARPLAAPARRPDRTRHDRPRRAFLQPLPARPGAVSRIADECFLGDEILLDLAEGIRIERQVSVGERVLVLTHLNVGYARPPAAAALPAGSRSRS